VYIGYDIVAYDLRKKSILAVVPDVTTNRDYAEELAERFNRNRLSPIHLEDVMEDLL